MQTKTRGSRRVHTQEFKARVLAACDEPGVTAVGVARAFDLDANLVHKWRRGCGVRTCTGPGESAQSAVASNTDFIALALPASHGPSRPASRPTSRAGGPVAAGGQASATVESERAHDIRIEWRRGATAIAVSWPVSAAPECANWLRQCIGSTK